MRISMGSFMICGFSGSLSFVRERKSTMKPTRTWVLIADGARARILENDGPNHGLTAIEGLEFQGDHSATHDLVPDREGRSFSSRRYGRSAIDARSDPHGDLKTKFANQLAGVLAEKLEQKFYDQSGEDMGTQSPTQTLERLEIVQRLRNSVRRGSAKPRLLSSDRFRLSL